MNINEIANQFGYTDNEGVYFTVEQLKQFVLCIENRERIKELEQALRDFSDYVRTEQCSTDGQVTYSTSTINHHAFIARKALEGNG